MERGNQAGNLAAPGSRKWLVALYIRLSKEDGNDVSNSVVHQEERLRAYLSTFEEEYELAGVFKDDGYTGTDTNREEFQLMLKYIREHKVNCVIVKDLSRLSRNVTDASYYIENLFIEYDVRFISLELPTLDSYRNPEQMNSILVPIQNVINDDFCRQTSIKVRGVFNQKRRQGEFIGAFAPYGFAKDPKDKHRLIIDPEAAAVIRDIFGWYVSQGLSKGNIARRLNSLGIPNPAAYKKQKGLKYENPNSGKNDTMWGPKSIRDILLNRMYIGDMVQGKYRVKSYKVHTQINTPKEEWFIVENTHEPIVDRDTFAMARKLHERDTRQPPGSKSVHIFSGLIRCRDCDRAMVRSQGGGSTKTTYYQCRTYREKSKAACAKHSVRAEKLEAVVYTVIKALISALVSAYDIAEKISEISRNKDEGWLVPALRSREKELARITAIKDSLYEDWKNGDISKNDYNRLRTKYDEQAQAIEKAINTLNLRQNDLSREKNVENPNLRAFIENGTLTELSRGIVVDMIDMIYIHEGGGIEIEFRFSDPFVNSAF